MNFTYPPNQWLCEQSIRQDSQNYPCQDTVYTSASPIPYDMDNYSYYQAEAVRVIPATCETSYTLSTHSWAPAQPGYYSFTPDRLVPMSSDGSGMGNNVNPNNYEGVSYNATLDTVFSPATAHGALCWGAGSPAHAGGHTTPGEQFETSVSSGSEEKTSFSTQGRKAFRCDHPRCASTFRRHADLDRHRRNVHVPIELRDVYRCDYPSCARNLGRPFNRRDHLRDHYREYHKEDIDKRRAPMSRQTYEPDSRPRAPSSDFEIAHPVGYQEPREWKRCAKCLDRIRHPTSTCQNCLDAGRRATIQLPRPLLR